MYELLSTPAPSRKEPDLPGDCSCTCVFCPCSSYTFYAATEGGRIVWSSATFADNIFKPHDPG